MKPIYQARNLKKYYGKFLALDLPEFTLLEGQTLVLEGANGSGKSSFLRLLAFLEEPSSGSLRYYGSKEPRKECTLLLQEPWLLHESVFNNVVLGLKLRGIRANLKNLYNSAMVSAGFLEPELYARRKPFALSGGEKQRVALASRLILKPAVLLLDEPTAHVDRESAKRIINALIATSKQGTTVICASHDRMLAQSLHAEIMTMVKPF